MRLHQIYHKSTRFQNRFKLQFHLTPILPQFNTNITSKNVNSEANKFGLMVKDLSNILEIMGSIPAPL
jgi:hypothetical protein